MTDADAVENARENEALPGCELGFELPPDPTPELAWAYVRDRAGLGLRAPLAVTVEVRDTRLPASTGGVCVCPDGQVVGTVNVEFSASSPWGIDTRFRLQIGMIRAVNRVLAPHWENPTCDRRVNWPGGRTTVDRGTSTGVAPDLREWPG
jgi:hypothetical protein